MAIAITDLIQRQTEEHPLTRWLLRLVRSNIRILMGLVLALSDAASLILALWVAVALRVALASLLPPTWMSQPVFLEALGQSADLDYAVPLTLLLLFVYAWRGLYPAIAMGPTQEIRRLSIATSMVFLALATFMFIMQTSLLYSRLIFVLAWAISLVSVPAGRFAVRKLMAGLPWWGGRRGRDPS